MTIINNEVKPQNPTQELLDLYRLRRKNSMAVVQRIIKNMPKTLLQQAAKQLGLYYKKSIAIESEQELDVLFNHALFHYLHNEKTFIERFAYQAFVKKQFSQDTLDMLSILQKPSYGVLSVLETLPCGGVYVEDCLNDKTLLLMDEALSTSAQQGLMIATSYLTFTEFAMTTGAALPIIYHLDKLEELIDEFDIGYRPFFELSLEKQVKFIAQLTKCCLENDSLDHIGFVEN